MLCETGQGSLPLAARTLSRLPSLAAAAAGVPRPALHGRRADPERSGDAAGGRAPFPAGMDEVLQLDVVEGGEAVQFVADPEQELAVLNLQVGQLPAGRASAARHTTRQITYLSEVKVCHLGYGT